MSLQKLDAYGPYRTKRPFPRQDLPQPIYDAEPGLVDLYWEAWQSAWRHVLERTDTPQPFYIDPAMNPFTTWIWDTCFMSLFCRHGFHVMPGIESLNNFYYILYDQKPATIRIHFADNPPLFAWVEWEYFQHTGDIQRLKWVLSENHYLEKHFDFMEHAKRLLPPPHVNVSPIAKRNPLGFRWRGNTSGMDNSPRGRNCWNDRLLNPRRQIGYNNILWIDLLAQQTLAADRIAKIAEVCQEPQIQQKYAQIYQEYAALLNTYYWDPQDGFFYDIHNYPTALLKKMAQNQNPKRFHKVKTVASFWPLLAGVATQAQADSMASTVADPKQFGGEFPWASLSRDDEAFEPRGRYWRGGVWVPTAYMGTKAIEKYGYWELADTYAEKLVYQMWRTFNEIQPHTIWEVYSPTENKPSTLKDNIRGVAQDFCGWSALGPISLFIENVIGIHELNARTKTIKWRIHHPERNGVRNLRVGSMVVDLVYENQTVSITTTDDLSLILCDQKGQPIQTYAVSKGSHQFSGNFLR